MTFRFRLAGPSDAAEWAKLHILSWRQAYHGILPQNFLDEMDESAFTERFSSSLSGAFECWFFDIDGIAAGRVVLGASRDEDAPPREGEVLALYLLSAYWGNGHGKHLMDFALERLSSLGCGDVIVWALEQNARARRFYEKCGFFADGGQKTLPLDGCDLREIRYRLPETSL